MINQGQLKNLATAAYLEFQQNLPGGIGPTGIAETGGHLQALINSFTNSDNYVTVNVGQLKYVAEFFYDRLFELGYCRDYPWANASHPPDDFALANVGQAKFLFSFDLSRDRDGDGLRDVEDEFPDQADRDGDGLLDGAELANGTDPNNRDSDNDGFSDAKEVNGTNPNVPDAGVDGGLYSPRSLSAIPWRRIAFVCPGRREATETMAISSKETTVLILYGPLLRPWTGRLSPWSIQPWTPTFTHIASKRPGWG